METQELNPSPIDMPGSTPNALQPPESPPLIYVSETVQNLASADRPAPSTICETCPAAIWVMTGDRPENLRSYCKAMNAVTWKRGAEPVTACDAREQEIARLIAELSKA